MLLHPERETPSPKLLRDVPWRDGSPDIEVLSPDGRWVKEKPWAGDVIDALRAGESYESMLRRFAARHPDEARVKWADYLVRRYLLKLERWGAVDLGLAPDPSDFANGRYVTQKRLGQGGFGTVWLARDPSSGASVVVKRASNYYHAVEVANRSLAMEASVLARCHHHGIARLTESFEHEGRVHIVREYVDGADIARLKGRTPRAICQDIIEVAGIVGHLHERGFLMLDLGPANFLRADRIVAVDVGLCIERTADVVQLPYKAGSPGFTSPELRIDRIASVRSDVWSLGALAFALAVGTAPHEKWREAQYAEKLSPGPLAVAILRALATDPSARPPDMMAAARVFAEAATDAS